MFVNVLVQFKKKKSSSLRFDFIFEKRRYLDSPKQYFFALRLLKRFTQHYWLCCLWGPLDTSSSSGTCVSCCVSVMPPCSMKVSYLCLSTKGHACAAGQILPSSCASLHLMLFLDVSCLKARPSRPRAELTASHSPAVFLGYGILKHPFSSWHRCDCD